MLHNGTLDHYIVQAPFSAPSVEIEGELYVRTDDIAHVKVKDRFGAHLESFRVYRRVTL